jgi:hypothetical protein
MSGAVASAAPSTELIARIANVARSAEFVTLIARSRAAGVPNSPRGRLVLPAMIGTRRNRERNHASVASVRHGSDPTDDRACWLR